MKLGYDLTLEQSQKLVMTPELIQAIKLLQFNSQELNAYIQEQVLVNPVLESSSETQESDGYDLKEHERESNEPEDINLESAWSEQIERLRDCGKDDISYKQWETKKDDNNFTFENFAVHETTLKEHLMAQLHMSELKKERADIGRYLIESTDDNGYLTVSPEETAVLFDTDKDTVESVLDVLHTFDPAGVAARDLPECLRIQLIAYGLYDGIYEKLITVYLSALADNKISLISRQLGINIKEVQAMSDIIKTLEPKPGRQFASVKETKYIIPDLLLEKINGEYIVSINEVNIPRLHISAYYENLLERSKDDKNLANYLRSKINSALWLIKSIEQRNQTVINVAAAVVNHQREFFDIGEKYLKPLTLRQIAEEVGVHESTVSRSVNGKYLQTQNGVYEIKSFFSGGVPDSGGREITPKTVKNIIKEMVDSEDKTAPLSDQYIAESLNEQGIEISRRTVAKYRGELNILSSSKRRRF